MNRLTARILMATLLAATPLAQAEDIDLFVGLPPSSTDAPNVLILLDNTANWNTAFTNEIAALAATVNGLPVDKFRLGLMLFTETGGGNSGNDGGYVRAAVRPLSTANKPLYQALVNSLAKIADRSNGGKLGKTMTDAYRYFQGGAPYSGNNKVKTDYTGNTSGTAASNAIYALPNNALDSKADTSYASPVLPGSCAKNYIIYISNGAAQDNNADTTAATTELGNAASAASIAGATTAIPISPSGSQDNVGDEWARFMKKSPLAITTYTVDVDKVTNGQGPGWTALLKSMANVSGGKYFDVSSSPGGGAQISDALNKIFSEIQSVNSVFASVSLPVSVNTQGTYLNQVYVGLFRPDADAMPRWAGNLKQYKLGFVNNVLKLLDANDAGAINSQTGFITECARSYWTPGSTDTYWQFRPQGACLAVANADASNYPDGNVVEKGGQGYQLRSTTSRVVKTCSATFASCSSLLDFNSTNVTQAMLGAADTAERDALINWAKGLDIDNEDLDGVTSAEMRPSAHGDVVHSRPVAINFGTDASPQVVVFYGDNNGVLHAINGNRSASIGSVTAGSELWAFIPPEFFSHIKRIRDNTTQINFFGNPTTSPTPLPKPYAIDGTITAYRGTVSGSPKAFIYASMRRGGRAIYAFDVTNPASPTLKWKKGCPHNFPTTGTVSDADCTSGLTGIGQTWSPPKAFTAAGHESGGKPLLIMGGGYDTCEDADPHTCTAATKGNHVYVLDGDTGALLKTLDTERAVVGDIFVIPDNTGIAKYAYAVDLGGNVYRISGANANLPFASSEPAVWTITKVADLGCATPAACAANRKFMFGPDVVEPSSGTYALLLGSGDREKPLTGYTSASATTNHFFMVKDRPSDAAWLSSEATNCDGQSVICLASLLPITTSANPSDADVAAKKGWYLGLAASEQVVTSAITVFGTVTFSSHQPAVPVVGSCNSNLGSTRVYNVDFRNAATARTASNPTGSGDRFADVAGDGLPPSPVAGMVTLDDGQTVPFVIGATADSPLEGSLGPVSSPFSQPKSRVYWYIQQ